MSSDYDFEDFDGDALQELDAIEAAFSNSPSTVPSRRPLRTVPQQRKMAAAGPSKQVIDLSEDSFDLPDFDFDDAALKQLDAIEDAYAATVNTRQTTLFGKVLPAVAPKASSSRSGPSNVSGRSKEIAGQQSRKAKHWDHTKFAKTGWKNTKPKGKGKGRQDAGDDDEEPIEFEQFPAPFMPVGPPPAMKVPLDNINAKHWYYPLNQPKRDYQFNIVKRCLFDNTIVALPTGLGKTFISGCVMLNFYRWFPQGKVVFVAPTKPLVAQQIEACHRTCGIDGEDATELTGNVNKTLRYRAWSEKRVFYMTPQTFINDLATGNCDARDIVLIVVDEAHRATGDYAYNQIVRFMMSKNPHHRILALTATPGSNPEAVQSLIDALHISNIEIRDEHSLDLRQFIHNKVIKEHLIQMSEDVNKIKDLLCTVMESIAKPLRQRGIINTANMVAMHSYGPQARCQSLQRDQNWARTPLMTLSDLARAMAYLIEGTMGMCFSLIEELATPGSGDPADKFKETRKKKLRDDKDFRNLRNELEIQRARGFTMHPKMDALKRLVIDHFAQTLGDDEKPQKETRAMVFVTYREAVEEIVSALNVQAPMLKATQFIGQGTDKKGNKGMSQKEQLGIINDFKEGKYNILVATSIGEEGLDIGEVDLIVCYDAQKTPIRMLQRSGRTGRKREGVVHLLLSDERERDNYAKSKDAYKHVQKAIIRGDDLELFTDVPRMLPDHVKPECLEKVMEIKPYVRRDSKRKQNSSSSPQPKKRKRNTDAGRNIPTNASTGFVPVSRLIMKGAKKQKMDGSDESGLESNDPLQRRTQSEDKITNSNSKRKAHLRKAATMPARRSPSPELTFSQKGEDDEIDRMLDEEMTTMAGSANAGQSREHDRHSQHTSHDRHQSTIDISDSGSSPKRRSRSPKQSEAIDITDSEAGEDPSRDAGRPSPMDEDEADSKADTAWLLDDDDDEISNFHIVDSSPLLPHRHLTAAASSSDKVEMVQPERAHEVESPSPTFVPAQKKKRRLLVAPDSSSPIKDASSSRLNRARPAKRAHSKAKKPKLPRKNNPIFDYEATHSGDEVSAGSSGSEEESESDRRFMNDFPETQVSPSYDQAQIYRMGLMTQAPQSGPAFSKHPVRNRLFGRESTGNTRAGLQLSSSPTRDSEPDEYVMDTFVVDDEEPIVYSDSSQ